MGNGEVLTPTAKFWMANNTTTGVCPEHGREEVVERSFPEVQISAALRLNVELRQADTTSTMGNGLFHRSLQILLPLYSGNGPAAGAVRGFYNHGEGGHSRQLFFP